MSSTVATTSGPLASPLGDKISGMVARLRVTGIIALAICAGGAFVNPTQFFRSYLTGYLWVLGIGLGCLPLLYVQHLAGGNWGLVMRRFLEAGTRTLPILMLLFIPILFGLGDLYEWARPDLVAGDPILQAKSPYLNTPFFIARTVFYFLLWIGCAMRLNRWTMEQDAGGDPMIARKMSVFSGPAVVFYCLTATFASVDWLMSLDAHWFSTIYGMLFILGQGLSAFTFTIAVLALLSDRSPIAEAFTTRICHDMGKLLLAFVMIWTYFSFSQLLIVWAGNLPEEIPFYVYRLQGGWQWLAMLLLIGHFALPFLLLLSRSLKKNPSSLAVVALWVLFMRFVDLHWQIAANFSHDAFTMHWMDILVPIGLGGLWLSFYVSELERRPILPVTDPYWPTEAHGHDH